MLGYKIVKDKILQKTKVLEGLKIYLIERSFLTNGQVSLLVCSNYKKLNKTFDKCNKFLNPDEAYDYYNYCCKVKCIADVEEITSEEQSDDINSK